MRQVQCSIQQISFKFPTEFKIYLLACAIHIVIFQMNAVDLEEPYQYIALFSARKLKVQHANNDSHEYQTLNQNH